jgi:hypothetical protein
MILMCLLQMLPMRPNGPCLVLINLLLSLEKALSAKFRLSPNYRMSAIGIIFAHFSSPYPLHQIDNTSFPDRYQPYSQFAPYSSAGIPSHYDGIDTPLDEFMLFTKHSRVDQPALLGFQTAPLLLVPPRFLSSCSGTILISNPGPLFYLGVYGSNLIKNINN